MPALSVSGEALACDWLLSQLCPHMAFSLCKGPQPVPSGQGPTLMTSFNLDYFLKGPISKYSHIEGGASTYELRGKRGDTIQFITLTVNLAAKRP